MIGYWGFMVLLFSAPEMSEHAGIIYLFVMYTMVNSVFSTLINCNEAPYLSNALKNSEESVNVVSFAAIISLIFTIVSAVLIPQLIANIGTTREGWSKISLMLAIPMTIVGLIRFVCIKEIRSVKKEAGEKGQLLNELKLLAKNKYILIFAVMLFFSNICYNSLSTNYYMTYVLGDIGYGSLMALGILAVIPVLVIMPKLTEKFGMVRALTACSVIGAVGFVLKLLAPKNLLLVFVSNMIGSIGYFPAWFMTSAVLIDGMDYGEWKFGHRAQGILGSVTGIACKVGTAFGAGMMGIMMGIAGYDGTAGTPSARAVDMIIALYSYIPALLCVVMVIFGLFYDLDKKLPQIRKELAERKAAEK